MPAAALVVSAAVGAYSANKAAKTAARGQDAAGQIYRNQQTGMRDRLEPWTGAGGAAADRLRGVLVDGEDFDLANTPGYDFGFKQGQRAQENSGAARGTLLGGRMLKELIRYGTGYANQFRYNELAQLAGLSAQGAQVAVNQENIGARLATGQANAAIGKSEAKSAGILGVGNSIQSALGQYAGLAGYGGFGQSSGGFGQFSGALSGPTGFGGYSTSSLYGRGAELATSGGGSPVMGYHYGE